jgi:hypothetical protein
MSSIRAAARGVSCRGSCVLISCLIDRHRRSCTVGRIDSILSHSRCSLLLDERDTKYLDENTPHTTVRTVTYSASTVPGVSRWPRASPLVHRSIGRDIESRSFRFRGRRGRRARSRQKEEPSVLLCWRRIPSPPPLSLSAESGTERRTRNATRVTRRDRTWDVGRDRRTRRPQEGTHTDARQYAGPVVRGNRAGIAPIYSTTYGAALDIASGHTLRQIGHQWLHLRSRYCACRVAGRRTVAPSQGAALPRPHARPPPCPGAPAHKRLT